MLRLNLQANILAVLFLSYSSSLSAAESLPETLKRATVRLTCIADGRIVSGSGTVVERRGSTATIATCAHLFRGLVGPIDVSVTFFTGQRHRQRPGQIIDYDYHLDVGLVTVEDAPKSPVFPISPRNTKIELNSRVLVAGCDGGEKPTARWALITANGRFAGRPNIEVSAVPKQGRSGGALVTKNGYLLGVCNGTNNTDHEGVYSSAEALHRLKMRTASERHASLKSRSTVSTQSPILARSVYAVQEKPSVQPKGKASKLSVRWKSNANSKPILYEITNPTDRLLKLLREEAAAPSSPTTGK